MPKDKKRSRDDDEIDQEVVQLALELSSVQQGSKGLDVKLKVCGPRLFSTQLEPSSQCLSVARRP